MAPSQKRLELQTLLEGALGTDHVYFQPPPNVQIRYPCIIFALDYAKTVFADDNPYSRAKRYQVTVIDRNPDTDIPDKIGLLPLSNLNRVFTAEGLHHYVFNLYF